MSDEDVPNMDFIQWADQFQEQQQGTWWDKLKAFFTQKWILWIMPWVLMGLVAWYVENWFMPMLMLGSYIPVLIEMRKARKEGSTLLIEVRMQDQIITHCGHWLYDGKPFRVPNSWIAVWMIPNARLRSTRTKTYGNTSTGIHTNNIIVCDFFQHLENGEMIIVGAEDKDFSNFAFTTGMNEDTLEAMEEIGGSRWAYHEYEDALMDMYNEKRFGEGPEAKEKVARLLGYTRKMEKKFGRLQEAARNLVLFYKERYPLLLKQLMILEQDLPRMAMAEASKMVHLLLNEPMAEEIRDKLEVMLQSVPTTFEERVRQLVVLSGKKAEEELRNESPAGIPVAA